MPGLARLVRAPNSSSEPPSSRTASREPRAPDPELPIFRLLHPPVFAHDHRRDGLAALDRRDVEALDAARHRRQRQHGAQRLERVVVRGDVLVEPRLVGHLGVARGQVEQAALLAALRHDDAHPPLGASESQPSSSSASAARKRRPARGSRAAARARRRTAAAPPAGRRTRSDRRPLRAHRRRVVTRGGRTATDSRLPSASGSVTSSIRSTTRPRAHLEDLDRPRRRARASGRTRRDRRAPALAIFCWRVRSVSIVRIASRSCAACSNRSAGRRLGHPVAQRRRPARRSALRGTAACARRRRRYSLSRAELARRTARCSA